MARRPPNNALQRTEAGGGVFSAIHVLRRQPPSLSLGPLGDFAFYAHPASGIHGLRRLASVPYAAFRLHASAASCACRGTAQSRRHPVPQRRRRSVARLQLLWPPVQHRRAVRRVLVFRLRCCLSRVSPSRRRRAFRLLCSRPSRLTTRSSEQRLAVGFFPCLRPLAPASVAELGGVRHLRHAPMKVTLSTRKPVTKITATDLRAFPIWEFATDEEAHPDQDETWVRPVQARSVSAGAYSQIVAASFVAQASSPILVGFMVVTTAEQPPKFSPGVVLFRRGYYFIPPSQAPERAAFAELLGIAFPLSYRLLVPLAGEAQLREGTIL